MRTGYPARQQPGGLIQMMLAVAVSLVLASCAGLPRTAITEKEQSIAEIPGMPNVRFFADAPAAEVVRTLDTEAVFAATRKNGRFDMLALSGGAWDGAYGAGILNGWTKSASGRNSRRLQVSARDR